MIIKEFQGEYRFLSNFWPCKLNIDGINFTSVEQYYQYQKSNDTEYRNKILSCKTPGQTKRLSKTITITNQFIKNRLSIMEKGVTEKFRQNPELKTKLLLTGNVELQEGNRWKDTFWGVNLYTGKGENNLGKILMKVRSSLQNE